MCWFTFDIGCPTGWHKQISWAFCARGRCEIKLFFLTLLPSEWPELYGVLAVLSAVGLIHFHSPTLTPTPSSER